MLTSNDSEFTPDMKIDYIISQAINKACDAIHNETNLTIKQKPCDSKDYDEVTSADYAAQNAIIEVITLLMPEAGMIAEEENYTKESKNGYTFVFDPIDGTKEFVRKGNEVSIMIGCLKDNIVIAAAIHNPFTNERYTLSAQYEQVFRSRNSQADFHTDFGIPQAFQLPPRNRALLTFEDPRNEVISCIASLSEPPYAYFNPTLVSTGSYGTNLMKLASNQVVAVITKASKIYPWDAIPVFGILKSMGYCSYQLQKDCTWSYQELRLDTTTYEEEILLVCHPSIFAEFIFDTYQPEEQERMVKTFKLK